MSEHDQHSSFIKTPQQLITVILLSFLVPIIGIVLLVQLVLSGPTADPAALTPQAIGTRIQPVGRVEFGAPGAAAGAPRSGEAVVQSVCAACHQAGVAGAPKLGDKAAWSPHIKTGLKEMIAAVTKGQGAMPPRGGAADLSDLELARAVVYMANLAGAKFNEPAAEAPAPAAAAAKPAAAADGKKVYDSVCFACHATSVAGSPKLGDKAAWAPRLKGGVEALVHSVLQGKGAMPPKGGNAGLSEGEIRAAVEFMVSQAK